MRILNSFTMWTHVPLKFRKSKLLSIKMKESLTFQLLSITLRKTHFLFSQQCYKGIETLYISSVSDLEIFILQIFFVSNVINYYEEKVLHYAEFSLIWIVANIFFLLLYFCRYSTRMIWLLNKFQDIIQ